MKTLSLAIVSAAIVLASCSSSKYAASSEYDDVYYNPNLAERQVASAPLETAVTHQEAMTAQPIAQEPMYAESQVYADEALSDYEQYKLQREAEMLGETYQPEGSEALYATQYQEYDSAGLVSEYGQENAPVIINNYYTDPNDYYYSSNLRRFSDQYYGWNYYDSYYTNPYFYTGRSMGWGMNIGYGYGGWGLGFSYGYPYYGSYYPSYYRYGYGGYYDHYYSHYGYGGYYGGYGGYGGYYGGSYWTGYRHGYWDASYYNSGRNYRYGRLDNRHYYGYSSPSNATYGGSKGSTYVDPRYRSRSSSTESARGVTRESTSDRTTKSAGVTRTNNQRTDYNSRDRGNINRNQNPGNRSTTPGQVKRNTYSNVKTTRTSQPANVQQRSASSNNRGTYTPSYSKPRTSSTPSYNRSSAPTRSYSQPSRTPSRSSSSYSRSSSTPSRSSSSYSRPSSTPSRSSSSYSRPSSSSRSSSSYSRSSGSSGRSSGSYSSGRSSSGSSGRSSSGSSGRSSSGSSGRSSSGSSSSSRR